MSECKERLHMKQIKVLGSGCRNCEITANVIAQAAKDAGMIQRKLIPGLPVASSQNAMATAAVTEAAAAHQTSPAVLRLTKRARKKSTNNGATKRLTTL